MSLIVALAPTLIWLRDRKRIGLTGSFVCLASTLFWLDDLVRHKTVNLDGAPGVEREVVSVDDIPESLVNPLRSYLAALPGYDGDRSLREQGGVIKAHAGVEHYIFVAFDPVSAMSASLDWPRDDPDWDAAHCRWDVVHSHGPAFELIEFLPSAFGPGYSADIYGWRGDYDLCDGWVDAAYYHLGGVARLPLSNHVAGEEWRETVVTRLRENGVVLLDQEEAEAYMKTEGRYWLSKYRVVEESFPRRLWWSLWKPATPVNDAARRLDAAVSLLRIHAGRPMYARYFQSVGL